MCVKELLRAENITMAEFAEMFTNIRTVGNGLGYMTVISFGGQAEFPLGGVLIYTHSAATATKWNKAFAGLGQSV